MTGQLLRIEPSGVCAHIDNTYAEIRASVGGTLAFLRVSATAGFYLHDDGIGERLALNVTASWLAMVPIYGNVVLCAAQPDSEGETLPPTHQDVQHAMAFAARWERVVGQITVQGSGDPYTYGSPDDLAPPMIFVEEDADAFLRFLTGDNNPTTHEEDK